MTCDTVAIFTTCLTRTHARFSKITEFETKKKLKTRYGMLHFDFRGNAYSDPLQLFLISKNGADPLGEKRKRRHPPVWKTSPLRSSLKTKGSTSRQGSSASIITKGFSSLFSLSMQIHLKQIQCLLSSKQKSKGQSMTLMIDCLHGVQTAPQDKNSPLGAKRSKSTVFYKWIRRDQWGREAHFFLPSLSFKFAICSPNINWPLTLYIKCRNT